MKSKIAKGQSLQKYIPYLLLALLTLAACGQKKEEKSQPTSERGGLESDYAGKVGLMLASGNAAAEDSIKFAQYVYQMAACEAELYRLQSALVKSYFLACDEKCERQRCSDGDFMSLAMVYFLEGADDSAAAVVARMANKAGAGESADIARVILSVQVGGDHFLRDYDHGTFRTSAAAAFAAVAAINRGEAASEWADRLAKIKSQPPDIAYARAYCLAAQGKVSEAWESLPDYAPLSREFPEPSYSETISSSEGENQRKVFLPLGLYVRKEIDKALLSSVLSGTYGAEYASDIEALKALAFVKGLGAEGEQFARPVAADGAPGPKEELLSSIELSSRGQAGALERLDSLRYPVSRAAYLGRLASRYPLEDGLARVLLAEIDSSRQRVIWESRILLSRALLDVAGPQEAFKSISNLGISDLSVRNNSPEWLAIYARSGLGEASQLSLASQVIYNLCQHYPHAIGLYELVQSYNHLCKYY